jgi:hypothetical protein
VNCPRFLNIFVNVDYISHQLSTATSTGAVQGNFLSRELGEWIRNHRKLNGTGDPGTASVTAAKGIFGNGGPVKLKKFSIEKPTFSNPSDQSKNSEVSEINLGGTKHNVTLYGTVTAHLDFMNEVTARTNTLQDLKFQILETTFDVIIGRPDIQKYQLGARLPMYFGATLMSGQILGAVAPAY